MPIQIMLPLGDEFIWVNGKADTRIRVGREEFVVEVKSIRRLPNNPLRHHVKQLQFYLAALNCQSGFIVYIDKSAMRHKAFAVSFQHEMLRLLERAKKLHKALTSNFKPEPDAEK